jgi:hypothetical protein
MSIFDHPISDDLKPEEGRRRLIDEVIRSCRVTRRLPHLTVRETQMRVIGLDVHRSFAEVAIVDKGIIEHAGRFRLEHRRVIDFGKSLRRSDEVVLEEAAALIIDAPGD